MTKTNLEIEIQKDLDAGKFGMICSNETTFKEYVFSKLQQRMDEIEGEVNELKVYAKALDANQFYLKRNDVLNIIKSVDKNNE